MGVIIMKKSSIFIVPLVSVLCFSSCEKNDLEKSKSEPIKTSYWKATLSNGYLFYVGIEELTKEYKKYHPIKDMDKYTNAFIKEITDERGLQMSKSFGMAYKDKNQIITSRSDVYEYDGENLSCTYEGETVQFAEITKEEYDGI